MAVGFPVDVNKISRALFLAVFNRTETDSLEAFDLVLGLLGVRKELFAVFALELHLVDVVHYVAVDALAGFVVCPAMRTGRLLVASFLLFLLQPVSDAFFAE